MKDLDQKLETISTGRVLEIQLDKYYERTIEL